MRLYAFCCRIFLRYLLKRCHAFLPLWDFLMKVVAFCCILFWWDILMRCHAFWPLWDVLVRFYALFVHNFRARYPDEMSCFFGSLRALRMRFHACWAVMLCLDEIPCFVVAAEYSFWWCDVRAVERYMLKDAGDWVYTMFYWTLRGFVCASWVVRWRGKWM